MSDLQATERRCVSAEERLVVDDLASENGELRAWVVSYREMALLAIEQLSARDRELATARRRITALISELREARGSVAA